MSGNFCKECGAQWQYHGPKEREACVEAYRQRVYLGWQVVGGGERDE